MQVAPVARAAHTAVATASGVCVFGGDDKDNKLSDTHLFSF